MLQPTEATNEASYISNGKREVGDKETGGMPILLTLFVYMDQFVISSESIAPRSPNSAPDAPTVTLF